MSLYYDRGGQPISLDEWSKLMEDPEYRRIGLDEIGPYRVSTVWLGLNHSWSSIVGGPDIPIIFETMVFGSDEQERYATEPQARCGHARMVALVKGWGTN
jgi:hypothetical protein